MKQYYRKRGYAMKVTIGNEYLQLTVDTLGAQMVSILGSDGCEYLWQGDPAYWAGQAPVLFPCIGRLKDKSYRLGDKTYNLPTHGFASKMEYSVEKQPDCLTFRLCGSDATLAQYPFDFTLEIAYRLVGSTVRVEQRVINRGDETMYFALGGHPGFCVPLGREGKFEDCYLEFDAPCFPERIDFHKETVLVTGKDTPYPLEGDKVLPLYHGLFDNDAIVLRHAARAVTLRSHASSRSIRVAYPDMAYIGFWHMPKTDAGFVYVEPWTSLPGRHGVQEDLSCRSDLIHLQAGRSYENTWTITVSR